MGGFSILDDYFVVNLDLIDGNTGEVFSQCKFCYRFDTQSEAEAFIKGRISAKSTIFIETYFIERVFVDENSLSTDSCTKTVYSCTAYPKPKTEQARVIIS